MSKLKTEVKRSKELQPGDEVRKDGWGPAFYKVVEVNGFAATVSVIIAFNSRSNLTYHGDDNWEVKVQPKPKAVKKPTQEYKGNGKHGWETVTSDTMRLRVPGGWLYSFETDSAHGVTFVPMPEVVKHAI
jgi:hypothetical protein